MSKTITSKELSRKLGISYNVILNNLSRFEKYATCPEGARYKYIYNEEFLTDLKKWYEYKAKNCKIIHYFTFSNAVKKLESMIEEIKNDKLG